MSTTVLTAAERRNGERCANGYTEPGFNVLDAAYHTAQAYPGGVAALAARMGTSPNTLQHKVNPNNTTHRLTLDEVEMIATFTGDNRIAQALAAINGMVCVQRTAKPKTTPVGQAMDIVKEFGEVLGTVNTAVSDGVVTLTEMRECEREVAELMAALNTTLGMLRSMMPKAPAA